MATTLAGHAGRRAGFFARLRHSVTLRYFALFTVVCVYGLIVLGGTVRATDSGTACPDWPLCHGKVIPPADLNVWIEFSHRLVASVVGFMILGLVYAIWRTRRDDKPMLYSALALVPLLGLQVIVGGITVGTETAGGVVAVHLTIALTLISLLIFITARLFTPAPGAAWRFEALPMLAAAGIFALIITGVFVSQRDAGLAYPDWPLFDGKVTPADSEAGQLHYAHRIVAGLVGLIVLGVLVHAARVRAPQLVLWGLSAALLLFVAQALLGAANVWLDLATSVRILHLALASAVWGVLVFTMAWAYQNGLRLTTKGPE